MTTLKESTKLRRVAGQYATIVNSDNMLKRRKKWLLHNKLEERTIPFVIEDNGTFIQDLMPALECEGKFEREIEETLLKTIVNFENIDDDRIFPPYFAINWNIERPPICPDLKFTYIPDAHGNMTGYESNTPLADLANSLYKLQCGEFTVKREETWAKKETVETIFGDILPVKIICENTLRSGASMPQQAVNMMGMENFYFAMMDQPENVHAFFEFIATEAEEFLLWLKQEQLILPNNGDFYCGSGSYGFTDELPPNADNKFSGQTEDCWGFVEAQEAVGISNEMYTEFIYPYHARIAKHYGLLYYGCCEPVHDLWSTIKQFDNLRKITISPWCDQKIMAEALGDKYIFSRKPHPMKLCGDSFDENAFRMHIKETLDIAKNCFVELIFRDTCTLNGKMKERIERACSIVHTLIQKR